LIFAPHIGATPAPVNTNSANNSNAIPDHPETTNNSNTLNSNEPQTVEVNVQSVENSSSPRRSSRLHGEGVHAHVAAAAAFHRMRRFGRFRIFSRHHALNILGSYTKDLRVLTPDTNNAILIDDDRGYASKMGQLPLIGVCYRNPTQPNQIGKNCNLVENGTNIEDIYGYNPLFNAAYVMGILLECKELLDSNSATSLRNALDLVLRHKGRSLITKQTACFGAEISKWYLQPYKEYEIARSKKVSNYEIGYHIKKCQWINKGLEHFKKHF
jgi:hypothetical protein